ncbi:hypothetical protein C0Q44_01570 [Paenibacillus sp. PCH8]|nr:hypothetical protein C0Q44_01570 [Paenibacillus sp. PCH8]
MIAPPVYTRSDLPMTEDPDGILVYGKGSRFAKSFLIKKLLMVGPQPDTGQDDAGAQEHQFTMMLNPSQ